MALNGLKAGVSREIINPPFGIYQIGYGNRTKGNIGIHDDLTATCLFLTDGDVSFAWVAVDILCLNEHIVDQIQEKIGPEIGLLISCSHTHSGPIAYADEDSPQKNQDYIRFLKKQIVKVIENARKKQVQAKLTWAEGEIDIAVNRREKQSDGSMVIGINPDGPVDRSLYTISVFDLKNNRLATLVNCAAHGTVQGPKNRFISADWIGEMRKTVEETLHSPVLFIQGATADLNPDHAWEADEASWQLVKKQGQAVGESVLQTVSKKFQFSNTPLHLSQKTVWLPLEAEATTPKPPPNYRKEVLKLGGLPKWLSFLTDYLLNQRYP